MQNWLSCPREAQLNLPPSLTERRKHGMLWLPRATATQQYTRFPPPPGGAIVSFFTAPRQGRFTPPPAVAGAAASGYAI